MRVPVGVLAHCRVMGSEDYLRWSPMVIWRKLGKYFTGGSSNGFEGGNGWSHGL